MFYVRRCPRPMRDRSSRRSESSSTRSPSGCRTSHAAAAARQALELAVGDGRPLDPDAGEWSVIIEFLRKTDQHLLMRVSRRMLNYLCWNGIAEAQELLAASPGADSRGPRKAEARTSRCGAGASTISGEGRRRGLPHRRAEPGEGEIVSCIQKWIKDDKSGFLDRGRREPGHVAHRHRPGARAASASFGPGRGSFAVGPDRACAFRWPPVLHRGPRLHQHGEELHRGRATSTSWSRHIICPPRATGSWAARARGCCWRRRSSRSRPSTRTSLGTIRVPRRGTSRPTAS